MAYFPYFTIYSQTELITHRVTLGQESQKSICTLNLYICGNLRSISGGKQKRQGNNAYLLIISISTKNVRDT